MCTDCNSTHYVLENNYRTCIECGTEYLWEPTYVSGYTNPQNHVQPCYYSRIRRFQKKLNHMDNQLIREHQEDILNLYCKIEFAFNCVRIHKRKYFFSHKVMLYYILNKLRISVEVPVLKTAERTLLQLEQIESLRSSCVNTW